MPIYGEKLLPAACAAFLLLTACGGGSSGGTSSSGSSGNNNVPVTPPSSLSYANPQSYLVGVAIDPLDPTLAGAVTGYSVSPALPAGLALNQSTGRLTGTPTTEISQANYIVVASNSAGSVSFALTIGVIEPGTLKTTVPTSGYPSGSVEKANFDKLNAIRLAGGFGTVAQDTVLDVAAQSHAHYLYLLGLDGLTTLDPHSQDPARSGFTGVTPTGRAVAAGAIGYSVGEVLCGVGVLPATACIDLWLNSPGHHQAVLNASFNLIGIGGKYDYVTPFNAPLSESVAVMTPALRVLARTPTGWIGVYPYDGQTNVPIGVGPPAGPVLSLQVRSGEQLNVTSFTLRERDATTDMAAHLLLPNRSDNYGNHAVAGNYVLLWPTASLRANTRFDATVIGSASGRTISKTWSFTTGDRYASGRSP